MASTLDIVGPDSPFIDALLKASEFRRNLVEQGHASADSSDALTTNRGQLAQLVNICFWTSLAAEEGRPVRGVVAVCSRQPSPTATGLVTPRPCSTSELVALLTAAGDAAVAVHAGVDGPEVWGFVDRAALPMHALRLRVGGTGTVIASLQSRVVAILSHGRVDIPANASWLDLAQLVSNALDRGEPFEKRLVRAERLLQIVAAMHQHGHGGAVIVTPPDGASPAGMNIKYALDADGAKIVQERVAMFESAARDSQLLEDAWMHGQPSETPQPQWNLKTETKKFTRRLLDTALRHVGHLSSVDGASLTSSCGSLASGPS